MGSLLLLGAGKRAVAGGGASAEATAFLARTSGLDATHTNAYTALIDGLVTDGIWAKCDALYIFATQDATTANLNLISTSYSAYAFNSPTFTADQGYLGASAGNKYVGTNFNPSTASSPLHVQNSAHISTWLLTELSVAGALVCGATGSGSAITGVHARYTGTFYPYANSSGNVSTPASSATSIGHFIANRSSSSAMQGFKNGSQVVTDNANTSVAVPTRELFAVGQNNNGTINGVNYQSAAMSIGSSLSGTDATNFYNRLRTYLTAVGVP